MPPRAFGRQLGALAPPELRSFVADLWSARGRSTSVDGRVVVADRAGRPERRLLVVARPHSPTVLAAPDVGSADAIVCPTPTGPLRSFAARTGVELYAAAALRELLLYAVDESARIRLLDRYFDVDALLAASDGDGDGARTLVGVREIAAVVAAVLTAALLVGGVQPIGDAQPRSGEYQRGAESGGRAR